jgi:hypothetical protein
MLEKGNGLPQMEGNSKERSVSQMSLLGKYLFYIISDPQ